MNTPPCGNPDHVKALDLANIYQISDAAIAQHRLTDYDGMDLCRKCVVFLVAERNPRGEVSGLQIRDFLTKSAIQKRETEEDRRRAAFSNIKKWVIAQRLLPDIGGKAPMFGKGKYVCRADSEFWDPDQLFLVDGRFISNILLDPDLRKATAKDQTTVLEGRALCQKHFQELQNIIDTLAKEHDIPPIRWELGRTHSSLKFVLEKAREDAQRRFRDQAD